jgi:hypothetical protein
VQDFAHVCEFPNNEVDTMMQLVTTTRVKSRYDHAGVYNESMELKEVQVLMSDLPTEKQHLIFVRNRRTNGPLQSISNLHRSFDPLHYIHYSFQRVRIVGMRTCHHR